jgi:hypothetical protein
MATSGAFILALVARPRGGETEVGDEPAATP